MKNSDHPPTWESQEIFVDEKQVIKFPWQKAENWQGDRVTIEPQTFCYLKEIKLKSLKI